MHIDFDLISTGESILKQIELAQENSPAQFNLLDIGNRSHLENLQSDYLSYLLDPASDHNYPEFRRIFLEMLKRDMPEMKGKKLTFVEREKVVTEKRRIDLYMETDENEVLILENKVHAKEQKNQLGHYYNWAKEQTSENNIYIIYLTKDGDLPSEYSISQEILENLLNQKHFQRLSYSKDITKYFQDIRSYVQKNDGLLYSGLVQIEDSINGFCRNRESDKIREKITMSQFIERYKESLLSEDSEEISELVKSIQTLSEGSCQIAILKLIIDSVRELSSLNLTHSVYFTVSQKKIPYHDIGEFLDMATKNPHDLGFCIELNSENLSLGIEFSDLSDKADTTYGFMSHADDNSKLAPPIISQEVKAMISEDFDGRLTPAEHSWWEYVTFKGSISNPWVMDAILYRSNWQKDYGNLSSHIVKSWILKPLEEWEQSTKK